ncbi:MAG: phasin family protein [Stellaceae bacterium]
MAEPPMAEPPMTEPPMAEPTEKPAPMVEPADHSGEIPLGMAAAASLPLPDMTAPAAVDQIAADEPEAPVAPPILQPPILQPPILQPSVLPGAPRLAAPRHEAANFGGETLATLAAARGALADGVEALSEEVAGLARRGIETATRTAIEMLAVKTFADALSVNAGFARASLGNWLGSSAKFSELGLRCAAESSRPFAERLAKGRIGVHRASP